MPDGYLAYYAQTATSGYTYGVYEIEIDAGHILSSKFISMRELQAKFS